MRCLISLSIDALDDIRADGLRRLVGWKGEMEDVSVESAGHGSWSDGVAIQLHTSHALKAGRDGCVLHHTSLGCLCADHRPTGACQERTISL
jgi:hypothetical protein